MRPLVDSTVYPQLARAWLPARWLIAGTALVQVVTGSLRFAYRYTGIPNEVQPARGRLALAKHGLFMAARVAAVWLVFSALAG